MLLWSDLQAVGNSVRQSGARGPLVGTIITLTLIGALSHLFGSVLVSALASRSDLLPSQGTANLFALLFMPTSLISVWFGLAACQRQLFEAKDLDLVLTAPITTTRVVFLVFLRVWFLTTLYGVALVGPLAWQLLETMSAPPSARIVVAAGVALAAGPPVAAIMAVTISLLRWFSGRGTRLLLTILVSALSVAFSLFLLTAAFGREKQAVALLDMAQSKRALPWMIEAAGNLVAASLGEPWQHDTVLRGIGFFLLAVILLYLCGQWYPRAVELSRQGRRPAFGLGLKRPWPASPVAALRRKEMARLLQEPRQLFGMLLYALMLFLAARSGLLIDGALGSEEAPWQARELVALMILWFLGVLMALPANFTRFVLGDGSQWDLFVCAPIRPGQLLNAKLQTACLVLLWPWLVVGAIGVSVLGVTTGTLLVYLALGLIGVFLALAILSPMATLPLLIKPQDDGSTGQHGRTLLAVFGLILLFECLVAVPALSAWLWLSYRWRNGQSVPEVGTLALLAVAFAAAYALVLAIPSMFWTRRNMRVLLRARRR